MSVDGTDSYVYTPDATGMTISAAPGNTGSGTRQVYWDTEVWYQDLEACQTWDTIPDASTPEKLANPVGELWQPGVALRIAPTPTGGQVRALIVNLNIWAFAYWVIQVNLWQTTATGALNISPITSFDMSAVLGSFLIGDGTLAAPPWHLCTRAIADQLTFKVWTETTRAGMGRPGACTHRVAASRGRLLRSRRRVRRPHRGRLPEHVSNFRESVIPKRSA